MEDRIRGFTLIEIMMVLIVIGILVSLVAVSSMKVIEEAKIGEAEAMIASLETAIAAYAADVGDYPGPGSWAMSHALYDTAIGQPPGWKGPYMTFKGSQLDANGIVEDPWDNMYAYQYNVGDSYFRLWSNGPDSISGTADDITNW